LPRSKKPATAADVDKLKKELLGQAKKDKHITQQDIFSVIPETPENADILDSLYSELAELNIEITTDADEATDENKEGWTDDDDDDEEMA
jgi:hypothetical protein